MSHTTQKYYDSIEDLPIWNWNKCHEKNDYTFLKINRVNSQVTKEEFKKLREIWEKVFEEYINEFGFSKNFLAIMEKKKQIAFYQLDFIKTSDKSIRTLIEIAENELLDLIGDGAKASFWKSKATIEKLLGFQLDAKTVTVVEFYSHIENLKKDGKLS